ncbi:DsbA family oxidoreductase [Brevibacterium yomogidense]|uniref:DsbA family oxidoreductase n=1 Tax=Brevibacterium yomogidense TaxID=946573 RepID=UPI0018E0522D|nr:DsbA family protein [Brevibacterium yomogidense]
MTASEATTAEGATRTVRIDVWTDLVCPFCYVGQARLDRAIRDEGVDVDLVVHAFELDPTSPPVHGVHGVHGDGASLLGGAPTNIDHLVQAKGMSRDQVMAMEARIGDMAAEVDMPYVPERPVGNTRGLHRVVQTVASTLGARVAADLFTCIQNGYFAGTFDPYDTEAVVRAAIEAGAAEQVVRAAMTGVSAEAEAAVEADIIRARELGVQGVPFMVFDNRMAAPGAMDVDTYRRALRQLADAKEA